MQIPGSEYLETVFKNTTTFEIVVTAVGGVILIMLKKWVRPIWVELTKGESRVRRGDAKFTVKDLLIENYRAMERIHRRQDETDKNLADVAKNQQALVETINGVQHAVNSLNSKLDEHITRHL